MSRLGLVGKNKFGSNIKIVKYINCEDMDILFSDYDWIKKNTRYDYFQGGTIACPYEPRFLKIGYLGEGEFTIGDDKMSKTWQGMINRCYNENYLIKKPTYRECTVCEEWHNFQNFAKWYSENYYEIEGEMMELDKDILIKGNKVYSPNTCIFVPRMINSMFTYSKSTKGTLPAGVNMDRHRYRARCQHPINGRINIGTYDTVEEAFNEFKLHKEQVIKQIADRYRDKIPKRLYDAMYGYKVEITD